jgi:hypothetical protein
MDRRVGFVGRHEVGEHIALRLPARRRHNGLAVDGLALRQGLEARGPGVEIGGLVALLAGGAPQAAIGEVGGLVDIGPIGGIGDHQRHIVRLEQLDEGGVREGRRAHFDRLPNGPGQLLEETFEARGVELEIARQLPAHGAEPVPQGLD